MKNEYKFYIVAFLAGSNGTRRIIDNNLKSFISTQFVHENHRVVLFRQLHVLKQVQSVVLLDIHD